ncbi:large ribosomal subunit protein eL31-like [Castor canadensis]|uniref:Large ribosomal subunit protein eL31-like n=1 Tax=Castor canadensis TaxID=51338 RepID=A0AC58MX26_CASCN
MTPECLLNTLPCRGVEERRDPTAGRTAPTKKGGEKKCSSATNEAVTREYTRNVHKWICGVGFKKCVPRVFKETRKFAMKEMGPPDVRMDTWLNTAVWAKGIGMSDTVSMCGYPEKSNENGDLSSKRYTLVTYVPVNHVQNLQMRTNRWCTSRGAGDTVGTSIATAGKGADEAKVNVNLVYSLRNSMLTLPGYFA